ncbi:MAG: VCBS repeat-containing protein [Bryobacterales bacterium]|nr:VCBS repeat-containing protein [Bryobacterales bacterium]
MRWMDVNGDGKRELVVAPLHGRALGDAPSDEGARMLVLSPPSNPETEEWKRDVASDTLHAVHNLSPIAWKGERGEGLLTASREGLTLHRRTPVGIWRTDLLGAGQPGEIKLGLLAGTRVAATVEPWHGSNLVVYRETRELPWERLQVDAQLEEGHAVAWADLDGDGVDELIAGWRRGKYGLAVYRWNRDDTWQKQTIDSRMATEDVAVGDLNGDGLPEIVAVGRATGNVRVYWNETKPMRLARRIAQGFANTAVAGGDFTGSRNKDVIVNNGYATLLYAGDEARTVRQIHQGVGGIFAAEVLDVDGDGDLDYIGARYTPGLIFWLERPADPLRDDWNYHEIDAFAKGGVNGIHGLLLGDVNRDGVPDLIANSAQPNGAFPNSLAWFALERKTGAEPRFVRHIFAAEDAPGLSHYFGFADINGDGRGDISSAGKDVPQGNWYRWWEQPADPTLPWKRHEIATSQLGATNILPGDLNGDGKVDFLASRGHGEGVLWFEGPEWKAREIDPAIVGPHSLVLGDIDGDGDLDGATCAKDDRRLVWYENDGKGRFTRHILGDNQAAYDLRLLDMDRDGDLDLLISGQASENVVWFENRLR